MLVSECHTYSGKHYCKHDVKAV